MNEIFKLLDNNEIIDQRADIPIDNSVTTFINILFRLGPNKTYAQKVTHEDIFRFLKATELNSYLEDEFPILFLKKTSLLSPDYWTSLFFILKENKALVGNILFFYRRRLTPVGKRELYDFLVEIWENNKNLVWQLSALILIHIITMKVIKESLC